MTAYVFDVDGTLTPSRGRIDPEFGAWFVEFARNNAVYLVTGSDREKTLEQVGETIYNTCQAVYQCSGNDVWQGNINKKTNNWRLHDEAWNWLEQQIYRSEWKINTGNHLEERPGLLNFSILGRNAMPHQREAYVKHDLSTNERKRIADKFNKEFSASGVQAQVAGETGLDIMPVGFGKEQILADFLDNTVIHFFGDKIQSDGNDYAIANAVAQRPDGTGFAHPVETWEDTWTILRELQA